MALAAESYHSSVQILDALDNHLLVALSVFNTLLLASKFCCVPFDGFAPHPAERLSHPQVLHTSLMYSMAL